MEVLEKWYEGVKTMNPSILDDILAKDAVFHSPVVWSPQEGKMLTSMYLTAAMFVLGKSNFKYVKEIVSEKYACLEFIAEIDGITINGVDIISFNDEGKIVEFKVMVRPMQGMMKLKEKMAELMQQMNHNK
ncbi:MAG: hypothetical protein ACI9O4_000522 [Chitinophagales bacterium]|jgi:hypothetical protein